MPDSQSKTPKATKTIPIAPAAEPHKANLEPIIQKSSLSSSPVKAKNTTESINGDKTPVNESPSVNHLKLSLDAESPKVEEELSSDHLISIMSNFGF
jgi:hypothetical protein